MKALKLTVFTILIIGAAGFLALQSYNACDKPVPYKLGSLPLIFGLSQINAVADIQNAADIWSKTYGKPLFIDSSGAVLTVNFAYDQRSALNTNIDRLQNQLNQKSTTLEQQINSYEADAAAFEKKLADFNARVNQINRSGGVTPDVYNSLIAQQNELQAEGDSLNTRASQLNLASHDYNSQVQNLNQNISQFNQAITQKPEEGIYNANDNTITIYFVDNRPELIHTLAHEFGHVLDMQHTDDPQAIMYSHASSSLSVTSEDKQQLAYVCREQSLPGHWLQELTMWLHSTVSFFTPS
jgi:chaperonin cofactor prefoldin